MNTIAVGVFLAALFALPACSQGPIGTVRQFRSLAPFVPSPHPVVDKMLSAARLRPNEVVYDIGCGDGRVLFTAVEKFSARAVGIEIDPALVERGLRKVQRAGLQNMIEILQADAMTADLSPADVVVLYLMRGSNDRLRPRLEQQLRPGTRVVSHDFEVAGWKPTRMERIRVYDRDHLIFVYTMPAQIRPASR